MHCLYILMRSDMDSLNPGKAIAQGAHAANLFVRNYYDNYDGEVDVLKEQWEGTLGFGTTVVLDVGAESNLLKHIQIAKDDGLQAGIVFDPTYPIKDGEATHLVPVNTCGYIFGEKSLCALVIKDLLLYR